MAKSGAAPRKRQSPEDLARHKLEQAHRTKMMRRAIPAIAPLVLLAVLSATVLMDTGNAAHVDYWCAAAAVGLTPVVIVLTLSPKRGVRRAGYGLLALIDLSVIAVGVSFGSKSAWFYGAAALFTAALAYVIWAVVQDRPPSEL